MSPSKVEMRMRDGMKTENNDNKNKNKDKDNVRPSVFTVGLAKGGAAKAFFFCRPSVPSKVGENGRPRDT